MLWAKDTRHTEIRVLDLVEILLEHLLGGDEKELGIQEGSTRGDNWYTSFIGVEDGSNE